METLELNDREFKIEVVKILNKMQENTDNQFNELRKQNKYFTKEIKTLKTAMNSIHKLKNELACLAKKARQRRESVTLKIGN